MALQTLIIKESLNDLSKAVVTADTEGKKGIIKHVQ